MPVKPALGDRRVKGAKIVGKAVHDADTGCAHMAVTPVEDQVRGTRHVHQHPAKEQQGQAAVTLTPWMCV
jgi:hypothetical protein